MFHGETFHVSWQHCCHVFSLGASILAITYEIATSLALSSTLPLERMIYEPHCIFFSTTVTPHYQQASRCLLGLIAWEVQGQLHASSASLCSLIHRPRMPPLPRLSLLSSIPLIFVEETQLCDACLHLPRRSCICLPRSQWILDRAAAAVTTATAIGFQVLLSITLVETNRPDLVFPSYIFHGTKEQTTAMAMELIICPAQHGGEECRLQTAQPTSIPLSNCALWLGYGLSVPQGLEVEIQCSLWRIKRVET